MNKTIFLSVIVMLALFLGCSNPDRNDNNNPDQFTASTSNEVVLSSQIVWESLNPARGKKSPQAGTVWGDRKGKVATGFLAKFVDGFSSPPHIHNVTYRAIVVGGLVHNDDPEADEMWMPTGSFWTQPAGESHITSASGESIAYVEIDEGPYLVKPIDESFDNGEQPVNISKDNIMWLNHAEAELIDNHQAEITFLWEKDGLSGKMIKLKNGFKGEIQNTGDIFHAVVIQGEVTYESDDLQTLDPGSYFTSKEESIHSLKSAGNKECLIYIRTNGDLKIK